MFCLFLCVLCGLDHKSIKQITHDSTHDATSKIMDSAIYWHALQSMFTATFAHDYKNAL